MDNVVQLQFTELYQEFNRVLLSLGIEKLKAARCAQIFTENTCDGVVSHGLNRFPGFVEAIKTGIINIKAEPELVSSFGSLEQLDGNRGIGPLNAEKAMKRAIGISSENGIGCVGLRNTNHWMRAGTYGLQAADAGCIGICWTNTIALMPPWGAAEKRIGNNPLVMCVPRKEGHILLDMAMSQFSNGKLEVLSLRNEKLPLAGGYNLKGELTIEPGDILESKRALPVGYWKGSGLALILDLIATLISGGDSTKAISQRNSETGVSQVFIAIDIESQMGTSLLDAKVNDIIEDFLSAPSIESNLKVRYPGQGMLATRKKNLHAGISVDLRLWQKVLEL